MRDKKGKIRLKNRMMKVDLMLQVLKRKPKKKNSLRFRMVRQPKKRECQKIRLREISLSKEKQAMEFN